MLKTLAQEGNTASSP